jgi:hypothetical protein
MVLGMRKKLSRHTLSELKLEPDPALKGEVVLLDARLRAGVESLSGKKSPH